MTPVLAVILVLSSCKDRVSITEDTLAVVGNRRIDTQDFVERYQDFRRRTGEGVHDTFEARRQVLNLQVEEEILISEAERRGLDKDRQARQERKRIEMQELLNAFNRNLIAGKVEVSEEELKRLFVKLNTKIKARHLYAETRDKADSLLLAVEQGATFEQLAEEVFQDPKLKDSGGSLGYFTVDEMDPDFEDAAFELRVGEVSKPIRTPDGYSIIKVEDRITQPLLTEIEYAKHRPKLHGYWKNRKIKRAAQSYVDSLTQALDVRFNVPMVKQLYASFERSRGSREQGEALSNLPGITHLSSERLVESKLGSWDVATFQQKARFTSSRQHGWVRSSEHLQQFVSGLIAREVILKMAKDAKPDQTPEYSKNVSEQWDTYLLTRIEQELQDNMVVPEDSLRSYYAEDPTRFAAPPEINLREIVVREKNLAESLVRKLDRGAAFEQLARAYSIRDWSAQRGGELGFLAPQDFGERAKMVFALNVGERVGPLAMDSTYIILECLQKKPSQVPSFEDARPEIEKTVRYLSWSGYRSSQIKRFRKSLDHLEILPHRLKEVRLTKVNRSQS